MREHVQVHLREQRNVQQHHEPQEVQVREGDIEPVRHLHGPDLDLARKVLRPIEAQQLTGHADRIEGDEGGVAQKDQHGRHRAQQIEGIVAVPDDFRHGPSEQRQR